MVEKIENDQSSDESSDSAFYAKDVLDGHTPSGDSESNETREFDITAIIKGRIDRIKKAKEGIVYVQQQIRGLNDTVPADHALLDEYTTTVNNETSAMMRELDREFDKIYKELDAVEEIKSESGTYKTRNIIFDIKLIRSEAETNRAFSLNRITRVNNLRERVAKLIDLVVEFKK